jgi:two-component system sensor histidine kinase/response regulator
MKNYFAMQIDYIFFFYGLAFIGLAVVAYILSREDKRLPWVWLGLFGLTHGLNEWLDLLAFSWGDAPVFAACRWAIMTASFMFLVEFGRLSLVRRRGHGPGRWLLVILFLAALTGGLDGWSGVNATCRYALGLVGGIWAGWELCREARRVGPQFSPWLLASGAALILYALATGIVVPRARFFPASMLNQETFLQLTSLPIQLVRGLLAVAIASLTAVYFQVSCPAENRQCHAYRARYMGGAGIALIVILISGWFLTQFLGNLARDRVLKDRSSIIQMAFYQWDDIIKIADTVVKTMSESPWIVPVFHSPNPVSIQQANSILDRYQKNLGDSVAYLLDQSGTSIASSNRGDADSFVGHNYSFRPYFKQALAGNLGCYFAVGATSHKKGYFASYPVRNQGGKIAGVAVIKMGMAGLEQQLRPLDPTFLVADYGIIFLASRPKFDLKSLGPVPVDKRAALARQYGTDQFQAIFPHQPANGSRVKFEGQHFLVCRQVISSEKTLGWSIVSFAPMTQVFFYRLLGIAMALVMVVLTLLFAGSNLLLREWASRNLASEARFRAMFTAAPEAVLVIDPDTREILDANPFMTGWLGYAPAELIGTKIDQIQDQKIADFAAGDSQDGRQAKILAAHARLKKQDGALVDVETSEARLIYQDKIRRLFFIRDITDRLRAEAALREMTILQQAILDSANYTIISTTPAGIITTFNAGAQRLLGYAAAEMVGRLTPGVIHDPEEVAHRAQELTQELGFPVTPGFEVFVAKARRGEPDENEWTYIRKDGTRFPVLLSVTALRDSQNNLTGFLGIGSDITARKRAEEENLHLASIVESSNDAIIGMTMDGTITSWNQGAVSIYGYTPEEMLGRQISLLIPPDRADELSEILDNIEQGQRVSHLETVRLRKDGQLLDISLTISPIKDTGGRIIGLSSIVRDITRQKQAEAELRKLSQAVQQSPATVVITDAQGTIEYVNPKFTQVTGYSFAEAMGQNPRILKSGEKTPEEYKELWDTITSGREWRGQFHNKKKNGELYWESASISPLKDADGVITHFVAVKEDITAMKEAQDEVAKLSLVASRTDNAVIITDKEGLIEWVNDGFTRMTGYTFPEVIGKRPGAFLQGPLSDPETIRRIRACLRGKEPFVEEIINYNKQGQPFWVSMDITPVYDDRGELAKFISIERDVTQRKETEEALRQAKEAADAANRAKSEFLASMSHEIRTPMNAIIGMAELLEETPLNQEQRKFVDVFHSAGENLLNIINDILDLSKVEAGQITLENIDFDLGELVEKVSEVMALRAHEKNIELACRLMPEVPIFLVGDPGRLRQVLTNLLGNAIKFTERGEVFLEVGLPGPDQAPDAESAEITLLFSIKDTGIGIPPDKMDFIFEKFTQADNSTARRYGGTGLGLAISKQLVELMGGRIKAESQPGQGSTFSFTLPLAKQQVPKEAPTVPVSDLRGLKILIVDDNATNRLILREVLTSWEAVVTEAADGELGLAQLKRARDAGAPYQLVLLDYRMPGMNGFEVAEAIKQDPTLVSTTLMMLTSDTRGGDFATARKLGLEAYLVKPVKRADLREAINLALSQATGPSEVPAPARPQVLADQRSLGILLVDDSADNRLLVESYLKTSPYKLDLAENGEVAVEKFKSGHYDLVLMDMQMPVMDGYTATATIRQWESQSGLRPTPIIALTAFALKEEVQKSLDAGCDAHLTKPIKKAILLEAINKMCPGN